MKLSKSRQSTVHSRQPIVNSPWAREASRPWQSTINRRLSTKKRATGGKHSRFWVISIWIIALASLSGCGVYSFSGVAIDNNKVKTISIDNFYNDSGSGPPNMSQLFTERIKDYYQQNTRLALVPENGDLQIEGAITRYEFVPVAARSSGSDQVADVASEMRLNITVEATYINTTDDQYDFENRDFTFFADFDADLDPSSVENDLIDQILEQIIFDIFTATVANW